MVLLSSNLRNGGITCSIQRRLCLYFSDMLKDGFVVMISLSGSPDTAATHRLKKVNLRCWRRGTKEMDILLGGYSDEHLPIMDLTELDHFEAFIAFDDPTIYSWLTGAVEAPEEYQSLLDKIVAFKG